MNNWRGWRKQSSITGRTGISSKSQDREGNVLSLTELAAREVAASIPFESVERFYPPVPEPLQLRIAFYSFPEQEEDIRLYACLANGSAEEFNRGEHMYKSQAVREPLQIGFVAAQHRIISSLIIAGFTSPLLSPVGLWASLPSPPRSPLTGRRLCRASVHASPPLSGAVTSWPSVSTGSTAWRE